MNEVSCGESGSFVPVRYLNKLEETLGSAGGACTGPDRDA